MLKKVRHIVTTVNYRTELLLILAKFSWFPKWAVPLIFKNFIEIFTGTDSEG